MSPKRAQKTYRRGSLRRAAAGVADALKMKLPTRMSMSGVHSLSSDKTLALNEDGRTKTASSVSRRRGRRDGGGGPNRVQGQVHLRRRH